MTGHTLAKGRAAPPDKTCLRRRGKLSAAFIAFGLTAFGKLFSQPIATHIFNKPAFVPVLFWMLLALPAMAMLLVMAFQAQHCVVITTIFKNLGISTAFVAAFGYLWYEQPEVLNAVTAAQIYAGATGVIFLVALFTWFCKRGISFKIKGYKDAELANGSRSLWLASLVSLVVQWTGLSLLVFLLVHKSIPQSRKHCATELAGGCSNRPSVLSVLAS